MFRSVLFAVLMFGSSLWVRGVDGFVDPTSSRIGCVASRQRVGHKMMLPESSLVIESGSMLISSDAAMFALANIPPETASALPDETIVAMFLVGLLPFAIATVEFWRRIAVGDSFGTGTDSLLIIGEDDAPASSRGRRVLGKDALAVAYVLFGVATAVLVLVIYSVLTTEPPPAVLV